MAKPSGVAGFGLGVLAFETDVFRCPTTGRPVMQRTPEDILAQVLPVGPRVNEMQVPHLIDFIRGRDRVPGTKSEKQEPAIFIHRTSRKFGRPVVFSCETLGEGQRVLMVEGECLKLKPQRIVRRVHGNQSDRMPGTGKPRLRCAVALLEIVHRSLPPEMTPGYKRSLLIFSALC